MIKRGSLSLFVRSSESDEGSMYKERLAADDGVASE